jgi:lipopolysaccharide transport system permease protein
MKKIFLLGFMDIIKSLTNWRLIHIIGIQDILSRYKRSLLGAFWITLNTAVMILALGLIFSNLFNQPIKDFLPYLSIGLIIWGFITAVLVEGCDAYINSESIIKQINLPIFTYLAKSIWKNVIILIHNISIIPIILLLCGQSLAWYSLLSVIGCVLLIVNLSWMIILLSIICSRYRDVTQIIQNILQVSFYLTPIVWKSSQISDIEKLYFLKFNLFEVYLIPIRDPLIGIHVDTSIWLINILIALFGWLLSIYSLGLNKRKIPYWV